jgi:hypothetical protein
MKEELKAEPVEEEDPSSEVTICSWMGTENMACGTIS